MTERNVERLCKAVWEARAEGTLTRDEVLLSQQLYVAVAADISVRSDIKYDPEMDRRVKWLREIISELRNLRPQKMPRAAQYLEDTVEWMLYGKTRAPSGKELAAGG
jgi:hypothetical protein